MTSQDDLETQPGGSAYQSYLALVNVGRRTTIMTTVPNSKTIDQKIPTRLAVVQVLTTASWVTGAEAVKLLEKLGYRSTTMKLRSSLMRLSRYFLVEGKKRGGDRYGRKEWKLTPDGATYALNPLTKTPKTSSTGSKRSQGKKTLMCIDPSKTSLNAAIESVVVGLVTSGETFSAHDVTKELRERVAKGSVSLDIAETGTIHIHGIDVAKVEHDYVRDATHELFHTGKMSSYVRNHNGNYWTYAPAPAAAPDPDPATPDPSGTPPVASGSYDGTPTL